MNAVLNHFSALFKKQPKGFYTLLYTEICELFGQFGITALLVLYMTSILKTSDNIAFAAYGTFSAFMYAIPLIGGYFADRVIGFKSALLVGIILMTIGNVCLVFSSLHMLYLGLAVFSIGCGFFTPTITAMVGRLYAQQEGSRDNAFILYYIAKNIGALFATLFCSYIAVHISYHVAFLASAIIMLSGYIAFALGSETTLKPYLMSPKMPAMQRHSLLFGLVGLLIGATVFIMNHQLSNIFMAIVSATAIVVVAHLYKKFDSADRQKLNIILIAILMMMVFFMFLCQGGTTLNLFIERIINRSIGTHVIPPSSFYALDPFFMILLGTIVMTLLNKVKGANQTIIAYTKIAIGLATLGVGFLVFIAAAQKMLHTHIQPGIGYVIMAYAVFPVAELCIMPIVISLITRIAPKGYEGFMIGLYMLGSAIASYLTGLFSKLGNVSFPVNTPQSMVDAAKIYQHVFILSALGLFMAALFSYLMIGRYKHKPIE